MKYRVIELLKCPNHPDSMLRVTNANISDVFPYAGELQLPVCRSGCGYLGNWFSEIPDSLPQHHRLDCRRCLGTEIETGFLSCPECDWGFEIVGGILNSAPEQTTGLISFDIGLKKKVSAQIEKILSLQPGELVLEFETLPENLTESWNMNGIEQIQVESCGNAIQDCRARSCAKGQGTIYHFGGPLRTDILRHEMLDALIIAAPSERLYEFDQSLGSILKLLRLSGQALIIFNRPRNHRGNLSERHEAILSDLPENFRKFRTSLTEAYGKYFLHVEQPEPENGFSVHKIDSYGNETE